MSKSIVFHLLLLCILVMEGCTASLHSFSYAKSHIEEYEVANTGTVVFLSNGKILLTKDEGESGDYVTMHLQYYKNNRLKYYKRVSKFFNSLCFDGVLIESEEYKIKGDQLILKSRLITDENKNRIDTTDCQFPYRYPFTLTYILDE